MLLSKLALSLSPAKARGFFDVPSLNAAPQSGDILSGNRGEGASKNCFLPLVAVLFVRSDSFYKFLPGCDVWDIERDARSYAADLPVIAHPPCRAWAGLRHMAKPRPDEKELALFAVDQVRRCGGVLEHPRGSTLWEVAGLPLPGKRDKFGGFTFSVCQSDFGHRARKPTWLYCCGIESVDLPVPSLRLGEAPCIIGSSGRRLDGSRSSRRPEVSKAEREATPPEFAAFLFDLAFSCKVDKCRLLGSGSYVIPGQSALECIKC